MVNLLGAHVSAAGGVFEAVTRSKAIGGTAFALFLKNEKRWEAKPYEESTIVKFKDNCKTEGYNSRTDVLPHGSYLINLGNPDPANREKSLRAMIDDLKRAELLNIGLYNFHPGSSLGEDKTKAIGYIAEGLNKAIAETTYVKIVLENMTGNPDRIVGTSLHDLAAIIAKIDNKERIGVCIDTCHTLAAGYDLRTEETFNSFWTEFDNVIGYKYLSGIHMNDSKYPLGSHRDVHENVGLGFVGLETFRLLMNKPELRQVPKVLETPYEGKLPPPDEVELCKWLEGKAADDPEVLKKAQELAAAGASARAAVESKLASKATTTKPTKKRAAKGKQTTLATKKVKVETKEPN